MVQEKRGAAQLTNDGIGNNNYHHHQQPTSSNKKAGYLYALITGKRPVSRRNRASWYLNQLNKVIKCDEVTECDEVEPCQKLVASSSSSSSSNNFNNDNSRNIDNNDKEKEQTADELEADDDQPKVPDICCVSITSLNNQQDISSESPLYANDGQQQQQQQQQQYIVTPNSRVLFLSRSIATSIILDLSPSVVSVSPQNDCVFLDSMFDALKRVLHLLVKTHEIPYSQDARPFVLGPKVFVSVIAYTPFVVAKNNQVIVQNRRISHANIEQILVEIWIRLHRLTQEIYELVSNTCGINLDFDATRATNGNSSIFVFPQSIIGGAIRHPGAVLEDIYELGLFSSSLMPRLSRLSMITITDGLFASTNDLNDFRLKSIAVSFVSLGTEIAYPDACFGYTPYIDLMKFIAKSTQGVYLSHQDLINSSHSISKSKQIALTCNPLYKLFCWTLHSEMAIDEQVCETPRATNFQKFDPAFDPIEVSPEHIARFFCVDRPIGSLQPTSLCDDKGVKSICNVDNYNYHDWRSLRKFERSLDADFEQVLASLLREGYLIKNIQLKHKDTSKIVARLVLHWRYNLDLEQELTAPYWNNTDPLLMGDSNQLILRPLNTPLYGDTYCEIIVNGSYSFLHNLYCDRRNKRRSEYREISYRQYKQLIDGVMETHKRLQYLSRFYRDSSLSKVPSFLLHGNSLFYEQPHTHRLTSTVENVTDEKKTKEFEEYWQEISCMDTKSWKNLMHIHTLRLVLEHDQPKHKNIHCQNANGRYTHVQCRRALSAVSNFIKSYASFALLEDTTYIKFIYNKDDDLRDIETSATKGFIVIRINKLLPIIVIYLMFTSGILDSHRIQIVSYLENQLMNCKLRNVRATSTVQMDNILKTKTISPSSESCCVIIKSPLERMIKVYSRNFIGDFLIHNWSHGLPGSYPYSMQQSFKVMAPNNAAASDNVEQHQQQQKLRAELAKEQIEGYTDNTINRYDLVFGKYLYGVRVIQTLSNLPHDLVPSIAANVLSKISAILVNFRIKQGFHIAFNNSGILNLVVELSMKDQSNEDHASSCLCQYIVFPPTVTNCPHANIHSVLNTQTNQGANSKPGSLSGSLANSDSYMKGAQDSNQHVRSDSGEVKIIKEYWIEQQYGTSSQSNAYHSSLQNMRYSEVVDHLFLTDSEIFECLLTYDLLLLLCDKMSLYYDLDSSLNKKELRITPPVLSPTLSTSSSNMVLDQGVIKSSSQLPSTLIEGSMKDSSPKVPLLEMDYKFSLVKFLDHCQQASLNILLFNDRSDFFEPTKEDLIKAELSQTTATTVKKGCTETTFTAGEPQTTVMRSQQARKMSMDVNELEGDHKREHRCSYQTDNFNALAYNYINPIYSPSLNHMFLETLHKRLKQMHDKELKLSEYDRKKLSCYFKRRMTRANAGRSCDTDDTVFSNCNFIGGRTSSAFSQEDLLSDSEDEQEKLGDSCTVGVESIDWRCFLRKGNQENLMIVLIPATLSDITKWLNYVNNSNDSKSPKMGVKYDPVCPIFVFRCSSTMINDHVMSFMNEGSELQMSRTSLESDLILHFGQPCRYMGRLKAFNDELNNEILPLNRPDISISTNSDEKTLEVVHFRAFLRKIKNTVLKSRFSSLNDAYLSELFIHKDDILYYINNVDMDTQKKYHVSSQLKSLADFIKSYEDYNDSLPSIPKKQCDQVLNSSLLQKCGLFLNQPTARFNEANPLIKQLHDKKLLYLMRCNYKVELPALDEPTETISPNISQPHSAIDQALERVDSLGRLEHFCLTPLLFSPPWRSKLATVRDHTLESINRPDDADNNNLHDQALDLVLGSSMTSSGGNQIQQIIQQQQQQQQQDEADDRWHQLVCQNYIKEYEQYIQTLGFNSIQIRYPSNIKAAGGSGQQQVTRNSKTSNSFQQQQVINNTPDMHATPPKKNQTFGTGSSRTELKRGSISTSVNSLLGQVNTSLTASTGYLIKFLNSGCLVFKVGFCKPYVYSILYSIEGERFNNTTMKVNMTTFLDELDNIKVTMHLHSFTYDYHLRSVYSYISGRQLTLSPGYHLISFLDDFRKYYQKAPNYARNHIICGEVSVANLKVTGQQLYNYIVTHNSVYNMEVLEMSSSMSQLVSSLSSRTFNAPSDDNNHRDRLITSDSINDGESTGGGLSSLETTVDQQPTRSHANDYLLIELKRERVRYRDSKDPDIFDCGLLITHDVKNSDPSKNCLTLKYFLLLTNQRDLYPKLIHNHENIISLGCHRPIRLGLKQPHSSNTSSIAFGSTHTTNVVSNQEQTICDEEITYLGYFSSDEMGMLKFLQEKTTNLTKHIEQVVRQAEIHSRRDYLWQKLMQRTTVNSKSDEIQLTSEELVEFLTIIESIDLAILDPQLLPFTNLHINWYMKLLKAFNDLKQSNINQHRIYTVKSGKTLLLYIDPKCSTAFILLEIDSDKCSVQMSMLLKDKQECVGKNSPINEKSPSKSPSSSSSEQQKSTQLNFELDQDCQQLVTDFINFCAAFMWSTLLT